MRYLLRVVFHPASSVLLAAVGLTSAVLHTAFIAKVLLIFFGVLVYLFVRPGTRRNNSLWRVLSSSGKRGGAQPPSGVTRGDESSSGTFLNGKGNFVIVSVPVDPSMDVLDHALAFSDLSSSTTEGGSGKALSLSTVMYVCRTPTERLVFWMPLARVTLWLLGGLMEYSRGLLLQLLKRPRGSSVSSPLVAIVLLPAPKSEVPAASKPEYKARRREAGSGATSEALVLNIPQKGIFAAALKTGASVVPAIVLSDGTVVYGSPLVTESAPPMPLASSPVGPTCASTAIAVPSPDQVRRLSKKFSEELIALYRQAHNQNVELRVL